jgi:hypothetical protein
MPQGRPAEGYPDKKDGKNYLPMLITCSMKQVVENASPTVGVLRPSAEQDWISTRPNSTKRLRCLQISPFTPPSSKWRAFGGDGENFSALRLQTCANLR